MYCGWCAKTLECLPISANTGQPLCPGICDNGIIPIEKCAGNNLERYTERDDNNVNYKKP